jgi:pilus assembly protein CpaB
MSSRFRTVVIAVAFGLLATIGVAVYLNGQKAAIVESGEHDTVLVAAQTIPAGTPVSELQAGQMVTLSEMPKRYIAEGALSDLSSHEDRVLAVPVSRGEHITSEKLRSSQASEVAYKLPKDKIAMAIPIDDVKGVGGRLQVGDRVVILSTFAPGPGGTDVTRVLLRDIEVLAAAGELNAKDGGGAAEKRTITVAVSTSEAEKLVFAEEKGKVWVGLSAAGAEAPAPTQGQTMESIFQ